MRRRQEQSKNCGPIIHWWTMIMVKMRHSKWMSGKMVQNKQSATLLSAIRRLLKDAFMMLMSLQLQLTTRSSTALGWDGGLIILITLYNNTLDNKTNDNATGTDDTQRERERLTLQLKVKWKVISGQLHYWYYYKL